MSLLVEWKLTAKQELNCEIYKSWRKCWINQVSFCHQISPVSRKAWMLPWILQELKNTVRKLAIAVNLEAIWFEFWTRSVSDGGNLCPLWSVILKSVWNSVGDTLLLRYSDRELLWAVLCSLLCHETDWNIRIEKQGYVLVYDFKRWCFDVSHS